LVHPLKYEVKLELFECMYKIRKVEEEIAHRYDKGKMRCPTHLSIGQELIPSIFANLVKKEDFAVSTHRGHAIILQRGEM
jgi:TPP-dependent pyruvate/acetoin dehydrogenase alpha subunit